MARERIGVSAGDRQQTGITVCNVSLLLVRVLVGKEEAGGVGLRGGRNSGALQVSTGSPQGTQGVKHTMLPGGLAYLSTELHRT